MKQGRRHDGFTSNNTTLDAPPVDARRKYLFLSLKANNVHDLFHFGAVCHEFFKVVFFELHHGREVFGVAGTVTYMGLPHHDGVVVSHGDSEICGGFLLDDSRDLSRIIFNFLFGHRGGGKPEISIAREQRTGRKGFLEPPLSYE